MDTNNNISDNSNNNITSEISDSTNNNNNNSNNNNNIPTLNDTTTTSTSTNNTTTTTSTTNNDSITPNETTSNTNSKTKLIVPDDESILNFIDINLKYEKDSSEYKNLLFRVKNCYDRYIKKDHLEIVEPLYSNGVCPRCIFRFMSIRDLSLYQEEYKYLVHLIHYIIHQQKYKPTISTTSTDTNTTSTTQPPVQESSTTSTDTNTSSTTQPPVQESSNIQPQVSASSTEESTPSNSTSTTTTTTTSTTSTNQDKMDIDNNDNNNKSTTTTTTTTIIPPEYDPNLIILKNQICICCLGSLQDTNNKELFLDEFIKKMKDCGYQFRDYSLALSLPTSTLIRDHSVFYYLKENFPSLYTPKIDYYDKVVEIKEGVKWVLGPIIFRSCHYSFKPSSDFRANMSYIHEETKDDHQFLLDIQSRSRKRQKPSTKRNKASSSDSNSTVTELLDNCSMKDFKANGNIPPTSVITKYRYQLTFEHAPIYLSGKYNKYVRDLPQSPWQFDDNVNIKRSVEELITKDLKELFQCDQITFSSSGREDVDVRMLGNGRPFFIELVNPHKIFFAKTDFEKLEDSINLNTSIKVSNLQLITKKETNIIKDSGGTKQKDYRCIVWCSKPLQPSDLDILNSKSNISISQQTPIRVLHRRSLMTRDKKIEKLKATYISPHFFTLDIINAQAGTYIKEFVHGDLGRTNPNISSLFGNGIDTDILQLDVLNVDLDFPKPRK